MVANGGNNVRSKAPVMNILIRNIAPAVFLMMTATPIHAAILQAEQPVALTVKVETAADTGKVMLVLYDSEAAYEGGAPVRAVELDIAAGQNEAVIEGLKTGSYGIKAFHDVNGNGKMDTNPFGMPVEPYAFSNNAVGNMGPAKWDRARFDVSGPASQTLNLR